MKQILSFSFFLLTHVSFVYFTCRNFRVEKLSRDVQNFVHFAWINTFFAITVDIILYVLKILFKIEIFILFLLEAMIINVTLYH